MRRIFLEIAYDGTAYHGFQIQDNEITIEQVLNEKLSLLLKEDIKIIGASRTDSGVHALMNVAVFDTEAKMAADKVAIALNTHLPEDIRAMNSKEVAAEFHPRHCDTVKTYEYKIYNGKIYNPMLYRYTQFEYLKLDVEKMKQAARYIVGEHDFKGFCSAKTSASTTVRNVYSLDIDTQPMGEDSLITITVKGNGFLYNMVRIIAGTLITVGKGRMEINQVRQAVEKGERNLAGPTAPAKGLVLKEIEYV